MNLLLFEPSELDDAGLLTVSGPRAEHLIGVLGVTPGDAVRVGMIDGAVGRAEVREIDASGAVRLAPRLCGPPPPRPRVDLLLALPRPKVLKRLYAPLASLGVGSLWLVNAAKVERYYFDSHAVRAETIRPRLLEGLAQARDTRLPRVSVERSLRRLLERGFAVDGPGPARRLLLDPAYPGRIRDALASGDAGRGRVCVAIGPEGGWTEAERALLTGYAFAGVGLGPRPLRSDIAVVAALTLVHAALEASPG